MKDQKHVSKQNKEIDTGKLYSASKIEMQIDNSTFEEGLNRNKMEDNKIEAVEEIQEDLMNIIEKLSEFGTILKTIVSRIDKIEEVSGINYKNHQMEIDLLRRDLLGERKTFVYQSVINRIIAVVDSLYNRKKNLSPEKDVLLFNQTAGIMDNLQNLLKSLGYESFVVSEGELFRTDNMECLGFNEGEENKVIRVERLGYKTEYNVMRPCGVIIGRS
jgi:molecular chaperone GrpE (heat shock protein)